MIIATDLHKTRQSGPSVVEGDVDCPDHHLGPGVITQGVVRAHSVRTQHKDLIIIIIQDIIIIIIITSLRPNMMAAVGPTGQKSEALLIMSAIIWLLLSSLTSSGDSRSSSLS